MRLRKCQVVGCWRRAKCAVAMRSLKLSDEGDRIEAMVSVHVFCGRHSHEALQEPSADS